MKIIKPSVEILEQGAGIDGVYKQIELAGRECYASSHKIGENTAQGFVERMVKSGHGAMLEHGTVYLQMPLDEWMQDFRVEVCPGRTHVVTLDETNTAFVTTNYRVLVERDALDLLKYMCEKPEPMHELRVTARFNTQIAITREYNRHRIRSIAEQSTRYCNYSKEQFGNDADRKTFAGDVVDILPDELHQQDKYSYGKSQNQRSQERFYNQSVESFQGIGVI